MGLLFFPKIRALRKEVKREEVRLREDAENYVAEINTSGVLVNRVLKDQA